ncbi:hypothetical protein FOMPIDRAFT_1055513 [Fomitopsis schrenkii]|uniref:Uncharacterized protein n=1 Tax=Fomitopsis schrenkii TaxID=2126942 RepID=S8DK44_FOMSC|nr:hypothetical protein FOMPIDRAFT_1055513 [Fomitopsis schrenkii]
MSKSGKRTGKDATCIPCPPAHLPLVTQFSESQICSRPLQADADDVFVAVGCVPVTSSLGLDKTAVEVDPHGRLSSEWSRS